MYCNLLKNSQEHGSENRTVLEITVPKDSDEDRAPAGWQGEEGGTHRLRGQGCSALHRHSPEKPHHEAVELMNQDSLHFRPQLLSQVPG